MANFITAPFFAAIGIAAGVVGKTNELIGTVRGHGDATEEAHDQQND